MLAVNDFVNHFIYERQRVAISFDNDIELSIVDAEAKIVIDLQSE